MCTNDCCERCFCSCISAYFSCGKIKSMKAIIDKQTNKCKGFGFIDFESHEDARLAINELQKKGYTAQLAKVNVESIYLGVLFDKIIVFFHLVITTTRTRRNKSIFC
jgi:RNA recognition motif-containing protein